MDERDSVLEMDYFFFTMSEISVKDKISPHPLHPHTPTQGHAPGKSVRQEPKPRTQQWPPADIVYQGDWVASAETEKTLWVWGVSQRRMDLATASPLIWLPVPPCRSEALTSGPAWVLWLRERWWPVRPCFITSIPWGLGSSVTCSALLSIVLFIELAKEFI